MAPACDGAGARESDVATRGDWDVSRGALSSSSRRGALSQRRGGGRKIRWLARVIEKIAWFFQARARVIQCVKTCMGVKAKDKTRGGGRENEGATIQLGTI